MPQSTVGHGPGQNSSSALHVGPHSLNSSVPSQGPAVVQSHAHPPSAQGQQQFQRLKVVFHEDTLTFLAVMCIIVDNFGLLILHRHLHLIYILGWTCAEHYVFDALSSENV